MRAGERAYRELRSDILSWRLTPGQVLGEVDLSERLGISRTPVREALSRLTADGLTEPHNGRGVVVSAVSTDAVRALYELRDTLDCRAAELAAARGDRQTFLELAEQLSHAAETLSDDPDHAAYYALVDRMDAEIDAAARNPYLQQALSNVRRYVEGVQSGALTIRVTGGQAIADDFTEFAEADTKRSEFTALPLIAALLLLIFGALVATVLPLAGAREAHRLLDGGDLLGKLILRP